MKESKFRLNKVIKKNNLKINTDRTDQDFKGNMVILKFVINKSN